MRARGGLTKLTIPHLPRPLIGPARWLPGRWCTAWLASQTIERHARTHFFHRAASRGNCVSGARDDANSTAITRVQDVSRVRNTLPFRFNRRPTPITLPTRDRILPLAPFFPLAVTSRKPFLYLCLLGDYRVLKIETFPEKRHWILDVYSRMYRWNTQDTGGKADAGKSSGK